MEDTKQTKKSDDVREALRERMRQMEQHMGALRRELTGAVSPVKEVITRHPVGSACTVLGVGVALGYLIASGRRSDESDQTEILDAAFSACYSSSKGAFRSGGTVGRSCPEGCPNQERCSSSEN